MLEDNGLEDRCNCNWPYSRYPPIGFINEYFSDIYEQQNQPDLRFSVSPIQQDTQTEILNSGESSVIETKILNSGESSAFQLNISLNYPDPPRGVKIMDVVGNSRFSDAAFEDGEFKGVVGRLSPDATIDLTTYVQSDFNPLGMEIPCIIHVNYEWVKEGRLEEGFARHYCERPIISNLYYLATSALLVVFGIMIGTAFLLTIMILPSVLRQIARNRRRLNYLTSLREEIIRIHRQFNYQLLRF